MTDNNAKDQAIAQAQSVAAMVAALNVDYDRLEELRDTDADALSGDELAELADLEEASNGSSDEDSAREAIQNDALDVQVRSDWHTPSNDQAGATEFQILLCTGGPAVRIMGELDEYLQPCRAWIEYQDWGTPWTQLFGEIEQSTLLEYCQQFYFGE
jgi:hypothetical protein